MKSIKLLRHFIKYVQPYWSREILLFFLMVITSAGSLASPLILKLIIDKVFPSGDFNYLMKILLLLVGINIFRITISYWSDYLYAWVSNHIVRDIRKDLFSRLLNLPMSFYDKNKTGDLIHRLNSEVNSVQSMLTGSFIRFTNNMLTILGLTIALCWLNWELFAISMVVAPVIFINTRFFQLKIHKIIKKAREKDSDLLNFFVERLENIKLIKSNSSYNYEDNKLLSKINDIIGLNLSNVRLSSGTRSISTFLVTLSPVLIFTWGGKDVMTGAMSLGSLIAFIQYLNRLFNPMRDIMSLYWDLVRSSVSMQRIFEFMSEPTEENKGILVETNDKSDKKVDGECAVCKFSFEESIFFKNVDFKYDGQWILNGLNLEFEKGKKYALVGSSGCGKSTIISLLNRFYETQNGDVLIDDKNIEDFRLEELRKKIALVTQDNQLFHESIQENIRYGEFNSTLVQVENAAKLVGIYEHTMSLKDSFDSVIGDKGTKISGGQKQRIAIARATLKDAEIVILDEATSALDSESEKQIFNNLGELYESKTMIIVSHRLSTIRDVDEIIYMDKGRVVEKGSYPELIEKKGLVWELFREQLN